MSNYSSGPPGAGMAQLFKHPRRSSSKSPPSKQTSTSTTTDTICDSSNSIWTTAVKWAVQLAVGVTIAIVTSRIIHNTSNNNLDNDDAEDVNDSNQNRQRNGNNVSNEISNADSNNHQTHRTSSLADTSQTQQHHDSTAPIHTQDEKIPDETRVAEDVSIQDDGKIMTQDHEKNYTVTATAVATTTSIIATNNANTKAISHLYWYPIKGCEGMEVEALTYDSDNIVEIFNNNNDNIRMVMKMILVDFTGRAVDILRYPILRKVKQEVLSGNDLRLSTDESDRLVEFKACIREIKFGPTGTRRLASTAVVDGVTFKAIDQGDNVALFFSRLLGIGGVRLMHLLDIADKTLIVAGNCENVLPDIVVDGLVIDDLDEGQLIHIQGDDRVRVVKIVKKITDGDGDSEKVIGFKVIGVDGDKRFVSVGDRVVSVDQ